MLLPIGDDPNDPRHVAWVNLGLIGVNVAVFLAMVLWPDAEPGAVLTRWAYDPQDPRAITLLTSMFLHGGLLHLAGNMLFLWIFGDNIEARLGRLPYLASYLGLGVVATLAHGAFADMPVVGASGAISGVQGLYFVACGRHRVRLFLWLFVFVTVFVVNARVVMLLWFALQDLVPALLALGGHPVDPVAHMAHLGGFVGGLLLMLVLRRLMPRIALVDARERLGAHASWAARPDVPGPDERP